MPGHSPVKLGTAKPTWALASDANIRMGSQWAGAAVPQTDLRYKFYANIPAHGNKGVPAGGNQVFADGSAAWVKLSTMYRFTRWDGHYGDSDVFWYQDQSDFEAPLKALLPNLRPWRVFHRSLCPQFSFRLGARLCRRPAAAAWL